MRLRIMLVAAAGAALISGGTVLAATHTPVSLAPTQAPIFAASESPVSTTTGGHPRLVAGRLRARMVSDAAKALDMTPQALRQDLRSNQSLVTVANAHHMASATLASELEATLKSTLNTRVASGKLTATRAQRLENVFAKHVDTWLQKPGKFWIHTERRGRFVDLSAKTLKMRPTALLADLKNGQSIAAVAAQSGLSEASLQLAMESAVQGRLLKAVQSGKISSAQEQKRLQLFDAHITHRLTRTWGQKRPASQP